MKPFLTLTSLTVALLCLAYGLPGSRISAQKKPDPKKKVEPRVIMAIPLGVVPGATTRVTIRGIALEKVKELRCTDAGVKVKIVNEGKANVPDKNPEKVGDTQVVADVTVPPEQKTPVSFVVVTGQGDTKPHQLLVDVSAPLIKEKEPNEGFKQAQAIQIPQIVDGSIDRPKDVDVYRFDGKAGQRLLIEVQAARHGSALDSIVTLYDADGQQVAASEQGASPDPRLEVTLPRAGTYFLSLIDANDLGGPTHVYRLIFRQLP